MAFLGSVKILTISSSLSSFKDAITCKRPISSGIKPKCTKSSGSIFSSKALFSSFASSKKPTTLSPSFLFKIVSKPSKAPPQTNKIFEVSICINS